MAIGDQVGKQAADEVVAALPQLEKFVEKFVDAQLAKLRDALTTVVGGTLADITAERTGTINQLAEVLHGVLDRVNGTAVVLGHGASPYGFTLIVPERAKT